MPHRTKSTQRIDRWTHDPWELRRKRRDRNRTIAIFGGFLLLITAIIVFLNSM